MNIKPLQLREKIFAICLKIVYAFDNFFNVFSLIKNKPFFSVEEFPWTTHLEKNWQLIRRELDHILNYRDHLPNFHDISPEQKEITNDAKWKTFFFYSYGLPVKWSIEQCPQTNALLQQIPGMKTAFFSILGPHKYLKPHRGPYKGVLRYHLGLKIPAPSQCGIRVADQTQNWEEGKSLIFDDTYTHEAWNQTDQDRVVLFVDFVRPLRQPAAFINFLMIKLIALTPFVYKSRKTYLQWEKKFKEHIEGNFFH